ncbi:MAG: LPXTG cell wall anchor domain-containing protein [Anaerovoracaceae bacterium]
MKKTFRIISSLVLALMLLCSTAVSFATGSSSVTYKGKAKEFIFQPGSDYSVTDLFTNFKGVMPGDTLTQQINVRNEASKKVNVKIYIRALGPAELENNNGEEIVSADDSADFLEEMKLTVETDSDKKLFDAPADQTAGLTDWVCLGTFRSGADVDLNVDLEVPITMGNDYQERIGALDWQFMAEEFPLDPDDPSTPTDPSDPNGPNDPDDPNKTKTGDDSNMLVYGLIALAALGGAAVVIVTRRRKS